MIYTYSSKSWVVALKRPSGSSVKRLLESHLEKQETKQQWETVFGTHLQRPDWYIREHGSVLYCGTMQSLQAWHWLLWSSLINTPPLLLWEDDDSIDHDTNLHIIYINGNRKKHQSLLLRGIGSDPGPSSPPSCPYPDVKLALIDSRPYTDHNFCAASEN